LYFVQLSIWVFNRFRIYRETLFAFFVRRFPACPREELLGSIATPSPFVHPSLAETCSFPLLEALALGLPIAAARMSALPEIAADAAIYFDP
jgi:hypothetical protein